MNEHGSPGSLRAFVAIAVPPPLVDALQKIQTAFHAKSGGNDVHWSRPAQLHLTLKFLGDVPEAALPRLVESLKSACAGTAPFRLALEGGGCFPDAGRPRIIWIGVGGNLEELRRLHQLVEVATRDFSSHSEEREFQPHLTIGRVTRNCREPKRIREAIKTAAINRLGEWTAEGIDLMRSELRPGGAHYSSLATFVLIG